MKPKQSHRVQRVVRFDPREAEKEFVVEWDETDPEVEDMDARETALRALGDGYSSDD